MSVLIAALFAGEAAAQPWDVPERDAYDEEEENDVTITFSAPHLRVPMMEVTGEFRTADKQSVAVIGGVGGREGFVVWDAGAQARQYFIGDFDTGLMLGAEAKWETVDYLEPEGWDYPNTGHLAAGPFLGGKLTLGLFALELAAGGQVVWMPGQDIDIGPLLNANAGVTF